MRRQLKCVVLLSLLLAALSPVVVVVATARRGKPNKHTHFRVQTVLFVCTMWLVLDICMHTSSIFAELPLMAATGDEGRQDVSSSSGTATAEGGAEVVIVRRRDEEAVKNSRRRFRRTSSSSSSGKQMPAASPQFNFGGGRIPFTADYHSVHRHPPTHN